MNVALYLILFSLSLCFFLSHYSSHVRSHTRMRVHTYWLDNSQSNSTPLSSLSLILSLLSSPYPPIPPIAPVPAVHLRVIDGGVHPFLPLPLSTPLSPKPLHPSLLPAVTRWLTTCHQQSTKAAITLHVQQRETRTSTNAQHDHTHTHINTQGDIQIKVKFMTMHTITHHMLVFLYKLLLMISQSL